MLSDSDSAFTRFLLARSLFFTERGLSRPLVPAHNESKEYLLRDEPSARGGLHEKASLEQALASSGTRRVSA